ncbi:MAG TPA: SurA N-terminal domain-containing protein [Verrucomicrobiae bacterium]|nr:SurA N-terminal domain-containing protein [Verrucomicrobiae bacterium]
MFIAHGEWVRKHSRWILGGILLLLIPSFIALFTTSGGSRQQVTDLPTVQGKPVDAAQFARERNSVIAQYIIRTGRRPPSTAEFEDAVKQQAVLRLIMLQKATELGIHVTDEQRDRQIVSQPPFRNEAGQFDRNRYSRFLIILNNYGISESRYMEIMSEELALSQLEAQVSTAAKVTPDEVNFVYTPMHEKLSVEVVEFDTADYKEPVTVTDEEAKTYYDQHQESFRRPAQVKVRYARFALADSKKSIKLTDDEIAEFYERNKTKYTDTNNVAKPLESVRGEIEQELLTLRADRAAADRATELTVKLVPEPGQPKPDFAKVCAEFGVEPQETGFFSASEKLPGIEAGVEFDRAAFALSPNVPISDPVAGEDAYYVLEYVDNRPSEIPPFDEIKQQVINLVKRVRIYDATVKRGGEELAKVKEAMTAGKSFPDACAALDLRIETPAPFTLADEKPKVPGGGRVQEYAISMATNTVSDFIQTPAGGLFFYLKDRQPPDREEFNKNIPTYTQQLLQRNRQALVQDWIMSLVRQEKVNFGRMRARPQPVESEEEPPAPTPAPAPAPPVS